MPPSRRDARTFLPFVSFVPCPQLPASRGSGKISFSDRKICVHLGSSVVKLNCYGSGIGRFNFKRRASTAATVRSSRFANSSSQTFPSNLSSFADHGRPAPGFFAFLTIDFHHWIA